VRAKTTNNTIEKFYLVRTQSFPENFTLQSFDSCPSKLQLKISSNLSLLDNDEDEKSFRITAFDGVVCGGVVV